MSGLEGKVVIITGGGSGIGKDTALKFAKKGAKVMVSDINEEAAEEVKTLIEKEGGQAGFLKADTANPADSENLVAQTEKLFSRVDIAVNNAGIGGESAPIGDYPVEEWDKVIAINLSGVFYGMKYQIPAMLKNDGGCIVNISSILGQVGFGNSAAYVAAKHGVVGLTKTAALEYSAQNIRVNAVGPGFIRTPLVEESLGEEGMRELVSAHPIGRLGESEEVADAIVWLSSGQATFVTGAYLAVDGGYLSR